MKLISMQRCDGTNYYERYSSDGRATTTMKKRKRASKEGKGGDPPFQLIDARIKDLTDWRGETLARVRMLIKQADPNTPPWHGTRWSEKVDA